MSKARCLLFLVIGALLMLSLVVDGQPTVDEDESCQPTTLEEAVNNIRADIQLIPSCQSLDETATAREVKLMKEDLTKVKTSTRDVGLIKEDMTEVKNITRVMKEDVMELKNITKDMAQNTEDLTELKNIREDLAEVKSSTRDVRLIKEDVTGVKNMTREVKEDVMELKNITQDMAMNRTDLAELKNIEEGMTELKNLLGSRQQACTAIELSKDGLAEVKNITRNMKEDVTELKNITKDMVLNTEDLAELKNIKEDLREMKYSTLRDVGLIKEDVMEVKNLLASRQQTCSATDSSRLCEYNDHSLLTCMQWRIGRISDRDTKPIRRVATSHKMF